MVSDGTCKSIHDFSRGKMFLIQSGKKNALSTLECSCKQARKTKAYLFRICCPRPSGDLALSVKSGHSPVSSDSLTSLTRRNISNSLQGDHNKLKQTSRGGKLLLVFGFLVLTVEEGEAATVSVNAALLHNKASGVVRRSTLGASTPTTRSAQSSAALSSGSQEFIQIKLKVSWILCPHPPFLPLELSNLIHEGDSLACACGETQTGCPYSSVTDETRSEPVPAGVSPPAASHPLVMAATKRRCEDK